MSLVQKFGGGILATKSDFQTVAKIVEKTNPTVVVVSAVQGVTDELISLLGIAKNGKDFSKQLEKLRSKHAELNDKKTGEIEKVFSEIEKVLKGVSYTGEYSDKLYASVVSRGEYLSAIILQSYLKDYVFWPAENGITATGSYINARCDFENMKKPPAKSIVTGFYGVNEKKEVCLFGRGGSDYSAGIIAKTLNAEKIEFWKNVDGFMTADPRIVKNARFISQLSFEEAAELCRFGAKILHPSSLEPLHKNKTVVEIKNVFKPKEKGTRISQVKGNNEIAAVTGRKNLAAISISGNEMVEAFGIAAKILTRVADANIPVDVIATGQANISFTVEEKDALAAKEALRGLEQFEIRHKEGLALIGIVGNGIKGNPKVISQVFAALSKQGIKSEMISQGASEIDLSIIVSQEQYEKAIQNIHQEFFSGKKVN